MQGSAIDRKSPSNGSHHLITGGVGVEWRQSCFNSASVCALTTRMRSISPVDFSDFASGELHPMHKGKPMKFLAVMRCRFGCASNVDIAIPVSSQEAAGGFHD